MLQVDELTVPGLSSVSFAVENGECVTVAGPSGSGKTLLLRATADLDPAAGTVTVDGIDRNSMTAPRWRSLVMYVPAVSGWWQATVSQHFADWGSTVPLIEALRLPPTAAPGPFQGCPPANSRDWHWRGRYAAAHACCCWTNPPQRSTRRTPRPSNE